MATKVVIAALKHIWTTLESNHFQGALIGGLSLSFWKHVRNTQDVDILIDRGSATEEMILDAVRKAGFRTKREPSVIDLGSVRLAQLLYEPKNAFMDVQIDLLFAESEFHRNALSRRVPVRLSDINAELFTLSCEDLLILKMKAGRLIDRADAAALLRLNRPNLDIAYVQRWVAQLHLQSEWQLIWGEAFPDEQSPAS